MPEIEAQIKRVVFEEPWYRIHTDHSEVKRLDTQDEDRGAEAGRVKKYCDQTGEAVKIVFTQSTKEKDGRVFHNNYFSHAEPIKTTAAAEDNGIEVATSTEREFAWRTHPETAWRISLGTGVKAGLLLLPSVPEQKRTPEKLMNFAREIAEFLFFEPVPDEQTYRTPQLPGFDEYGKPSDRPDSDSDIPFLCQAASDTPFARPVAGATAST